MDHAVLGKAGEAIMEMWLHFYLLSRGLTVSGND